MRLVALIVLAVGNLFAIQVHAGDVSPQPLTRVDCNKAEMPWDENANVCGPDWERVWGQPLTRYECDKAGMAWDDTANVCGTTAPVNAVLDASDVAESVIPPLTKPDCARADMAEADEQDMIKVPMDTDLLGVELQNIKTVKLEVKNFEYGAGVRSGTSYDLSYLTVKTKAGRTYSEKMHCVYRKKG